MDGQEAMLYKIQASFLTQTETDPREVKVLMWTDRMRAMRCEGSRRLDA